jgi:hypothetical protein
MITNYKFQITPDQILFPQYPTFELFVRKNVTGWIFTDEDYDWSCLPGYTRENMGSVSVSDHTDVGGVGYEFYLYSRKQIAYDPAANPCYGILHSIPKSFPVGSTGSAVITYGGAKIKQFLSEGRNDACLYSDWKLINVY